MNQRGCQRCLTVSEPIITFANPADAHLFAVGNSVTFKARDPWHRGAVRWLLVKLRIRKPQRFDGPMTIAKVDYKNGVITIE